MKRGARMALLVTAGAAALLTVPLASISQVTQSTSGAPVYQPPMRGTTAGGRIGGGTRGTGEQTITLSVIAPAHPGLTVSAQPRLYWYLSDAVNVPAELTVVDRASNDPLLELVVAPPIEAGIHAFDLSRHGVRLAPGVRYEWFVALIDDAGQRSNDIVAGGEIELVRATPDLDRKLAESGDEGAAGVYAQAGIWYDAVDSVSVLVERNPDHPAYRRNRAALLNQVGLENASAFDRGRAP